MFFRTVEPLLRLNYKTHLVVIVWVLSLNFYYTVISEAITSGCGLKALLIDEMIQLEMDTIEICISNKGDKSTLPESGCLMSEFQLPCDDTGHSRFQKYS